MMLAGPFLPSFQCHRLHHTLVHHTVLGGCTVLGQCSLPWVISIDTYSEYSVHALEQSWGNLT